MLVWWHRSPDRCVGELEHLRPRPGLETGATKKRVTMLNLIQVGLGPLGKMIATDVVRRGVARIVAAVDVDAALHGKPLNTLCEAGDCAVPVRGTVAEALDDARADGEGNGGVDCAIVSTSSDLAKCVPTFRELLSAGVSVVSTCEELLYPWLRHQQAADELNELALRHGSRLLGTGVNPGFVMDTLAVAATAVCRSVERVRVYRVQDASTRRVPFQQKIGATLTDDEFQKRVALGTLRHVGLGESLHFIARYLGLRIDRWEESIEPIRAERALACTLGPIATGSIAGVRQVAKGWDGSACVVELDFRAAIGQDDPHDRVVIDGEPALDLRLAGGVHGDVATCAITVNAIWPLLSTVPGLHTMATIPPVRCISRDEATR